MYLDGDRHLHGRLVPGGAAGPAGPGGTVRGEPVRRRWAVRRPATEPPCVFRRPAGGLSGNGHVAHRNDGGHQDGQSIDPGPERRFGEPNPARWPAKTGNPGGEVPRRKYRPGRRSAPGVGGWFGPGRARRAASGVPKALADCTGVRRPVGTSKGGRQGKQRVPSGYGNPAPAGRLMLWQVVAMASIIKLQNAEAKASFSRLPALYRCTVFRPFVPRLSAKERDAMRRLAKVILSA